MPKNLFWSFIVNPYLVRPYFAPIYKAMRDEQKHIYRHYIKDRKKNLVSKDEVEATLLH